MWVEDLVFDDYVNIGGGSIGGRMTWDEPPDDGAITNMGRSSIPQKISARWFSFRTQTFYEIDLTLPERTEQQISEFYRDYRPPEYTHDLMIHISGDGRMRVWWRAWCGRDCGEDRVYLPIVKEATGQQVDGDPARYANRTAQQRERGRIPPEPEPPPR